MIGDLEKREYYNDQLIIYSLFITFTYYSVQILLRAYQINLAVESVSIFTSRLKSDNFTSGKQKIELTESKL